MVTNMGCPVVERGDWEVQPGGGKDLPRMPIQETGRHRGND